MEVNGDLEPSSSKHNKKLNKSSQYPKNQPKQWTMWENAKNKLYSVRQLKHSYQI